MSQKMFSDMMKKGKNNKRLFNQKSKEELELELQNEKFTRTTISFYRYAYLNDLEELRDELFLQWNALKIKGRIYIADEGINAQLSCPEPFVDAFRDTLNQYKEFKDVPFKIAVEDQAMSFLKLQIKIRKKILADGQDDNSYDVTNVGKHLSAKEWNKHLSNENSICIDMRNHYESEIGHFEGAICPDVDTFREELPEVLNLLEGQEDKKILLYCTGGIRCEKTSAFLKHHGYEDVNQLHGGIIDYAKQIKEEELDNKYKGSNFVFDDRRGEKISDHIISSCHQCGKPCDAHTNCINKNCNLLFLQCEDCKVENQSCCSQECVDVITLTHDEQIEMRKQGGADPNKKYRSSLRPKLNEIQQQKEADEK